MLMRKSFSYFLETLFITTIECQSLNFGSKVHIQQKNWSLFSFFIIFFSDWKIFLIFFQRSRFSSFKKLFLLFPLLPAFSHSIKCLLNLFCGEVGRVCLNFSSRNIWCKSAFFHQWIFILTTYSERFFFILKLSMEVIQLNRFFLAQTSFPCWKFRWYHSLRLW